MGDVAYVTMSGPVTDSFSNADITSITSDLAEVYGVNQDDLATSIDYVTSGNLDVTIPETMSNQDAIAALEGSISDVLGVHPKDVRVTIENGVVTYFVTEPTFEEAEAIQTIASSPEFTSLLAEDLMKDQSDLVVNDSITDDEILFVLSVTIDTTDAEVTTDPDIGIEQIIDNYNLADYFAESNLKISFSFV